MVIYLDDILIYSDDEKGHVQHVTKVLKALDEHNLRLKLKKCEFHKTKVDFLGYTVGVNGVQMSDEKIAIIKNWPTPKNTWPSKCKAPATTSAAPTACCAPSWP